MERICASVDRMIAETESQLREISKMCEELPPELTVEGKMIKERLKGRIEAFKRVKKEICKTKEDHNEQS
ncbi:hypothetical protein [Thermosulfurimonas sp. F29]|uniref:hypothetical protein n=1 Tax=Thermosulfurimonas sp. F29 TaxID=2867247 RepID=UPI001C8312FD|nr:hypothetical protein [Thermosulfurimonas sp. F29]MBX6424132.1 hypothetical protein [Thermosulfurimonas sp. F29]